jgi:hypothetical protein
MAGCSSVLEENNPDPARQAAQQSPAALGTYQDFEDVLIPSEMDPDYKNSFVFETPGFKTGILRYEGRVDAVSLINYFESNMPRDGWKLRSKMKYGRSILIFEKPNRDCIINISDETFSTVLEVMVAPRQDTEVPAVQPDVPVFEPLEQDLPQ